ncbi:MAG: hypothetical protein KI793_01905 [Rivularia sp. (in: Bacteria)]|nr:hypothetical protein [Rivularia sp. MS3]
MKISAIKKRILYVATFLLVLLSLIIPKAVNANMSGSHIGESIGEPTGDFRNLGIVWEKLNFDLRPLKDLRESTVTAIYQIRNDGEEIPVELLFVSPGIKTSSVTIDGKAIAAEAVTIEELPPTWRSPYQLPTSDGGSIKYFPSLSSNTALKFKPTIEPGEHQIQVKYVVEPSSYKYSIYKDYKVIYILAPAKDWAFFKRLEVEIKIPEKWKAATSLPMKRTGNILKAAFNKIPADNLTIATSPHLPWYLNSIISLTPVVFYIGGLIAARYIGIATTRKIDELVVRLLIGLFVAVPLGIAAFCVLVIIGFSLRNIFSNLLLQKIHIGNAYASTKIVSFLYLGVFISGLFAFITAIRKKPNRNVET